ncbi:MAG: CPBP family glutamic-type intramembrane protease, partial [Alistipes sp.]|nr:CPBP family glutamic-type intramembrane protease [Alistipes sp.]
MRGCSGFCCLTAGFCQELVYRGYNILMLRYKGVNKWVAMLLAVFPFILIHSFAPIYLGYLFGVYFSALYTCPQNACGFP